MVDAQRSRSRVLARLAALSSTVLALGAGAHVAAAGDLPDGRTCLAAAAATGVAGLVLARGPLRAGTLLPAVALWQWLLHAAFAAGAATPAVAHVHVAHGVTGAAHAVPPAATHLTTPVMLAAHALATLVTVALLVATERGAERALERLAWALPVLAEGLLPPAVGTARRRAVLGRLPGVPLRARTPGARGSRAPPVARVA